MRKLFGRSKKQSVDENYLEEEYNEEESFDWDESEDYAEDETEDTYIEENGEAVYYEADAESEDGEYYADAEFEDGEYYADAEFEDEEYYEEADDEAYYVEDDGSYPGKKNKSHRGGNNINPFLKVWQGFLNMGTLDRVIAATGAAVLILAVVTGGVYASAQMLDQQVASFAETGLSLDGIELIGESGLMAVADARMAKTAAAEIVAEEEQKDYDEEEYSSSVTVVLNMTSIQKDLKIKFINKSTGKLIANVPFTVSVTDPDGKTSIWSDDDMDGIIYYKDITPGNYKVTVNSLDGEKYADYTLPAAQETIAVKKDIAYQKVDVSDEVKTESEVDATKEDTKVNETKVESALTDTVKWVDSTATLLTYTEVLKSTVPDPTTLAMSGSFMRLSYVGSIDPTSKTLNVGESFTVKASGSGVNLSGVTWSSSNTAVATVDSSGKVTAVAKGTAQITFKANGSAVSGGDQVTDLTGTCTVTVNESLVKGSLALSTQSCAMAVGVKVSVKATASGFTSGKELSYTVSSSNTKVAAAVVDTGGNVTVTGVAAGDAVITVKANYKDGGTDSTAASAAISIKVTNNKVITLDKTTAAVYIGTPVKLTATVTNATTNTAVTAESSNTGVATVSVSQKEVTVTGVAAGSATITVKYLENGEEVKAACTVTVKANPKEDRSSKLKDAGGNQLYVLENGTYREAYYADYYTAEKFFIQGEAKYTGWQTLNGKVYFFDANGKKVTGEQVIQGAKYNFASDGSLVVGSGTSGIDVSKWNGTIDWTAVKNSGVSYVIIRCGYRGSSQGTLIEDPKYYANIKGATAAGLKVGIYFFTQAVDEREAVEEASMVLDMVKNYKISYPIFLDVESSGGRADSISKETRTAVCRAFCKTIQDAGYTAGIYANKTWLTSKIDAGQLSAYKIWLAQYASSPTYTGRYDLWQYKSTGRVSGISGNVDLNISYLGY